jgi:UDP-N-acetylmuramate dehydrogenase
MKPGDVGTVFAGARVYESVPLAPLTTLRVGPVASRVITCISTEQVVATLRHLDGQGAQPLLVLAGGSNVVIADALTDLTVIRLANNNIRIEGNIVRAEAGAVWDDVVVAAIGAGLGGLECLSGIPGSAGATPVQNVGAYGVEVADRSSVSDTGPACSNTLKPPSCWRWSSRWTPRVAVRRCATASW